MVDTYTGDVPNLTQTQPEFDTNTQAILDYIASLAPQLNAWVGAYVQSTTTSSNTENALGTGSKTFAVEAGKGFKEDMTVRASAGGGNFMDGNVTSYSGTSLTVNFTTFSGPGTFDEWDIFLTLSGSDVTLGSNTFTGDQFVPDDAYNATSWNGNASVPTKNAVRDVIESIINSIPLIENLSSNPSLNSNSSTKGASPEWVNKKALIQHGTKINTSGSAAYDFTIPADVKEFILHFDGVSTNGSSVPMIQFGDASGVYNSGYIASAVQAATSVNGTSQTVGCPLSATFSAATTLQGVVKILLANETDNSLEMTSQLTNGNATVYMAVGKRNLTSDLTTIRLTTIGGTDLFDAGSITPSWKY
jgi:hypothetical protein